ncbi:hypothetical protein UFOVP132_188 [uncultured Caudovirales phage]|uniref:Uncharacterized protein n=1 Tax=uncultured Caudovirales phage TaxID=2100421 RepID=A0A6J5LDM3_9CAUD|nr:hypothetical protein UFOVP132_188 [uncultured Caudovirales phage]
MNDKLLEALKIAAMRIDQLTSGPGGIMEMKQTISDKENEIARLQKQLDLVYNYDSNLLDSLNGWNYGQGAEPWLKDVKE